MSDPVRYLPGIQASPPVQKRCPIDGVNVPTGIETCRVEQMRGGKWEKRTVPQSNGGSQQTWDPEVLTPELMRSQFGPGRFRLRWIGRREDGKHQALGQSTHFDIFAVAEEPDEHPDAPVNNPTPTAFNPLQQLGISDPILTAYLAGYEKGQREGDRQLQWLTQLSAQTAERERAFWDRQSQRDREYYDARTALQAEATRSLHSSHASQIENVRAEIRAEVDEMLVEMGKSATQGANPGELQALIARGVEGILTLLTKKYGGAL